MQQYNHLSSRKPFPFGPPPKKRRPPQKRTSNSHMQMILPRTLRIPNPLFQNPLRLLHKLPMQINRIPIHPPLFKKTPRVSNRHQAKKSPFRITEPPNIAPTTHHMLTTQAVNPTSSHPKQNKPGEKKHFHPNSKNYTHHRIILAENIIRRLLIILLHHASMALSLLRELVGRRAIAAGVGLVGLFFGGAASAKHWRSSERGQRSSGSSEDSSRHPGGGKRVCGRMDVCMYVDRARIASS